MKKEVERAYLALKNGNVKSLRKISEEVIKKSGVSQDSVSVAVAVLLYSLSKFIERGKVSDDILIEMRKLSRNFNEANLKKVFSKINKIEVRDVFGKAKIHKASSLHEHGISLGKVSELLGVSKWDLMDYVGGKKFNDVVPKVDVLERVDFVKKYKGDIVFDSGVIITLSLNNLLGKLNLLKKDYGEFYITNEVKKELVDRPIKGRKFKLEALQIQRLIDSKVLKVYNKKLNVNPVLKLCNSIFHCGKDLKVLDKAEVESFLLAVKLKCAYVVDERTMRMLIEHPFGLEKVLERKMRCNVEINKKKLDEFKEICPVKVLRSVELMVVAYSKGYFKDLRGDVLDALLWGLKLRGSSISFDEIKKIKFKYS